MKRYVFFSVDISNMGGGQMYVRNKLLFLKQQGWDVMIIPGVSTPIIIPELKAFNKCFPEIMYSISYFSQKKQKAIVDEISLMIKEGEFDEIVIESSNIGTSTWAEVIAKNVGARHFSFLLTEINNVQNRNLRHFFLFKHRRHELACINSNTIKMMFSPFKTLTEDESYCLRAYSDNVEADTDSPFIAEVGNKKNECDYVIGILSRLDKPFVIYAIKDICSFARLNCEKKILLVMLGGYHHSFSPQIIKEIIKNEENVELIFTGYIYPIPIRLLNLFDLFISSSGSSRVCSRSGIATIPYDARDLKPIGILGYTTNSTLFHDKDGDEMDAVSLMKEVLIEKKYPNRESHYNTSIPDYSKHIEFMEQMEKEIDYFDTNSFRLQTLNDYLHYILLGFGYKKYQKIRKFYFSIKG